MVATSDDRAREGRPIYLCILQVSGLTRIRCRPIAVPYSLLSSLLNAILSCFRIPLVLRRRQRVPSTARVCLWGILYIWGRGAWGGARDQNYRQCLHNPEVYDDAHQDFSACRHQFILTLTELCNVTLRNTVRTSSSFHPRINDRRCCLMIAGIQL